MRRLAPRPPLPAGGVLLAALIAGASVTFAPPATGQTLDATGWWNVANTGRVPAGPPPDVTGDDLLVQGLAPTAGIEGADPLYQAVAAVRYTIEATERPARLVFTLRTGSTPAAAVKACAVLGYFAAVKNGRWSDVPRYSCEHQVVATTSADATTLTLDDIAPLVRGTQLSIILLPAGPGRVVIAAPIAGAAAPPAAPAGESAPPATLPDFLPPVADGLTLPPTDSPLAPTADLAAASGTGPATAAVHPSPFRFPSDSFTGKLATAAVLFLALAPLALRRRRRLT